MGQRRYFLCDGHINQAIYHRFTMSDGAERAW
jgi:hypothetical protein